MTLNKTTQALEAISIDRGDSDHLETIRNLLFKEDRKQLRELKERLVTLEIRVNDPDSRTVDVSEILVPAIRKRLKADESLGDVLKPVVVEQFHQTSRNDPEIMADALFPILGPAIRKMIAAMLTPDKTSKKRTYQVEQLFLIDKETGLPICHVSSDAAITQDADMVSGMLSAIQSFVHEAFSANDFDGLNTLQIGELSVWIEWGPSAILAAVIRGVGPEKLREAMQLQLEQIHHGYSDQLTHYEGDAQPFEDLKPELTDFLQSHDGSLKTKVKALPSAVRKWLMGAIVALVCLLFWLCYQWYDNHRWTKYVTRVESQPGIVVTKSERHFRQYILQGFKDPLAIDTSAFLEESRINPDYLNQNFEPYHALHPDFVLARALSLLKPPTEVTLTLTDTTLQVSGGDIHFIAKALRLAPTIAGINNVSVRN